MLLRFTPPLCCRDINTQHLKCKSIQQSVTENIHTHTQRQAKHIDMIIYTGFMFYLHTHIHIETTCTDIYQSFKKQEQYCTRAVQDKH